MRVEIIMDIEVYGDDTGHDIDELLNQLTLPMRQLDRLKGWHINYVNPKR